MVRTLLLLIDKSNRLLAVSFSFMTTISILIINLLKIDSLYLSFLRSCAMNF